jgi:hypothetical protein
MCTQLQHADAENVSRPACRRGALLKASHAVHDTGSIKVRFLPVRSCGVVGSCGVTQDDKGGPGLCMSDKLKYLHEEKLSS